MPALHALFALSALLALTAPPSTKSDQTAFQLASTAIPIPFPPRQGAAIAFVPSLRTAYVFGGASGAHLSETNWQLHVDTARWQRIAPSSLQPAAHSLSSAAVSCAPSDASRAYIHVIGGLGGDRLPRETIHTLDASTAQWLRFAQNEMHPMQRSKAPVALFDTSLVTFSKHRESQSRGKSVSSYVWAVHASFAGDAEGTPGHVIEYSVSHPPLIYAKQNITSAPHGERLHGHRAILHPKRTFLYVTGGAARSAPSSRVDVFSVKEKRWVRFPALIKRRSHHILLHVRLATQCVRSDCTVEMHLTAAGGTYSRTAQRWAIDKPGAESHIPRPIEFLCVVGGRGEDISKAPISTIEVLDLANVAGGWREVSLLHAPQLRKAMLEIFGPIRRFCAVSPTSSCIEDIIAQHVEFIREVLLQLSGVDSPTLVFLTPEERELSDAVVIDALLTRGGAAETGELPERLVASFQGLQRVTLRWDAGSGRSLPRRVYKWVKKQTLFEGNNHLLKAILFSVFCVLLGAVFCVSRKRPHFRATLFPRTQSSLAHGFSPLPSPTPQTPLKSPFDTITALFSSFPTPPDKPWVRAFPVGSLHHTEKSLTPPAGDLRLEMDSIKYTRANRIGSGACGVVYKAIREDTGSVVALKVIPMHTDAARDEAQQAHSNAQLAREVGLMRSVVSHPNLISYHGCHFDPAAKELIIAMEFAEGGSVGALCRRLSPTPLARPTIQKYTRQICMALYHLHSNNILHRDLKGDNVLISKDGTLKLADFGTAKRMGGQRLDAPRAARRRANRREASGGKRRAVRYSISGTPLYMAPEAFVDVEAGPADFFVPKPTECDGDKSDVWSLGCTVVEMINGGFPPWPPHRFPSLHAFIRTVRESKELPLYNIHLQELDEALVDFLVRRCLVRDATRRASVRELLQHPFLNV